MDEVNSFLELVNNSTLDGKLKLVYSRVVRLIRNAHKVIVSDAVIANNVLQLLRQRSLTETVFVRNVFKKLEGKQAHRLRNEKQFQNKLMKCVRDGQYFLFASDSAKIAEKMYLQALEVLESKEDSV